MLNRYRGFSLIELMIVLAVLGILLVISYPSYQQHVLRSYRAEASASLLQLANAQEQYRADHGVYSNDFTMLGHAALSPSGRYALTISLSNSLQAFEIKAEALGLQQADTACTYFSLNQFGQRSAASVDPAECWK
ncbi:type IV pilin protein [Rheinheimera maricola]|uniref:Type IV pilin protein n=1 Tax=Rheinheimera maricola TaxID=2793282 RepID=A0ABS7XAH2_9GAMM|nr:type IV pilin protein [Rheinheimera maricola]MBZ9612541.1 type IV pilin protein [Rheinheimera maricola]